MADLFTPWRESPGALAARHVGREEVCEAIRRAAEAFVRNKRPVHLFVFGPAGSGTSHLLALLRPELNALVAEADPSLPVTFVPDDLPILGTAERMVAVLGERTAAPSAPLPRCLVLFDGLERQLTTMAETERRRLRQVLDDSGCWLVATGRALPEALTRRDTAFYGQFSPWTLPPLPSLHAATLLDALAGPTCTAAETWHARRRVLAMMGGGHPRSLVALGRACAAQPHDAASDNVRVAVGTLAADFRARFRALSPLGQQVVHAIATAIGPLTPSQLADQLDADPRVAATASRRLADDGVLRSEREGRLVYYEIVDTLFRLWLEIVDKPWSQARIHVSLRQLEASLGGEEPGRRSDGAADRGLPELLGSAEPQIRRHVEGQWLEASSFAAGGSDQLQPAEQVQ